MKIWKFLKTNRQFTLFLTLALGIAAIAVFAPWIAPKDPYEAVMSHSLQAPGGEYLCGTDKLGRDVLSRVIYGTRSSLVMTLCLVVVIFVVGTALGILAGYFGGFVDCRYDDFLSRTGAGYCHCRSFRTQYGQCRPCHFGSELDKVCQTGSKYGVENKEKSLH